MKGLYMRRKCWWVRFTPITGARQERVSLGTDDLAVAIVRAREIIERAQHHAREKAGSCEVEVANYLEAIKRSGLSKSTVTSRRYVLTSLITQLGARSPTAISRAMLQRWFDKNCERNAHTAVAYLNIARFWMKWLVKTGRINRDLTKDVEIPRLRMRQRRHFLLPKQAKLLLDAAQTRDMKFAIYCGLHAGLRKLEVVEARSNWFDLDAKLLHVQATDTFEPKDRDNRTIPLTDEFAEWLKQNYTFDTTFMLAPDVKQGAYRYRYDFRTAYETLVANCGLPNTTFHDLRRTFASLHVSRGTSIYKVARWLGDRVDVVEDHYGHLIPNDQEINSVWK